MQEPDTQGRPLREYLDPDYRPLCATLADVRANIDRLDDQIVKLIAERAMYVKDAARFKRDAYQVSAPARQAEVFEKARRRPSATTRLRQSGAGGRRRLPRHGGGLHRQ